MEDHGRGRCEWGHAGAEEPGMAAGASLTRGASQAAAFDDGAATEGLLPLIAVGRMNMTRMMMGALGRQCRLA